MKNADQLRRLAEGLPSVPPEKFTMIIWGLGKLEVNNPEFTCRFAGCAIGWFGKLVKEQTLTRPDGTPSYEGETNYMAIALYFDITHHEAMWLFSPLIPGSNRGRGRERPHDVSRRILEFLAEKGA